MVTMSQIRDQSNTHVQRSDSRMHSMRPPEATSPLGLNLATDDPLMNSQPHDNQSQGGLHSMRTGQESDALDAPIVPRGRCQNPLAILVQPAYRKGSKTLYLLSCFYLWWAGGLLSPILFCFKNESHFWSLFA